MKAEPSRRSIAVVYHSGSGGTALAARLAGELLAQDRELSALPVEDPRAPAAARDADLLALFFPTYFLRPSPSAMDFIAALGPFDPPKRAYLVATFELYPEDSLRAAALALAARGFEILGAKALRAPGSDAACVLPAGLIPWLYRYERKFPRKLLEIVREVEALASEHCPEGRIPKPKRYAPFAQVLQRLLFDRFARMRGKFKIIPERCSRCGACAALCGRGAWSLKEGCPRHDPGRCELCTRCIHRCPSRAIVLLRAMRDNPRLDSRLYAVLEARARRELSSLIESRSKAKG